MYRYDDGLSAAERFSCLFLQLLRTTTTAVTTTTTTTVTTTTTAAAEKVRGGHRLRGRPLQVLPLPSMSLPRRLLPSLPSLPLPSLPGLLLPMRPLWCLVSLPLLCRPQTAVAAAAPRLLVAGKVRGGDMWENACWVAIDKPPLCYRFLCYRTHLSAS